MTAAPSHRDASETRSETTARLFSDRAAASSAAERAAIEEELVRLNMPLARDLSRRFRNRGIADDDLEQVAYVGLVKAVRGFQRRPRPRVRRASPYPPSAARSAATSATSAGRCVRRGRSRRPSRRSPAARPSSTSSSAARRDPARSPTHLGLELEQVVDALGAQGCFAPASLDAPVGGEDGDETPGQRLGELDHGFDLAEARAMLAPLLAKLSRREQLIVEMRFFRGCTQAEIGKEIGVSQMHVSRLLSRLVARLREELAVAA